MSTMAQAGVEKIMELTFDGELTIHRVAELKTRLAEALQAADGLVIDLGGASRADLAFLQLFCSAHRTAQRAGKFVKLAGMSAAVDTAVTAAGFLRDNMTCGQGCSERCLWMES